MKQNSPHFKNGKFHNLSPTPQWAEGYSFFDVIKEMLFKKVSHKFPSDKIPAIKTDLNNLSREKDVLVWFGHSSYFMQIAKKRFLIDPVFSQHASPVPGMIKAFKGTGIFSAVDMPEIDYLIISHDHYDHLDHKTIVNLQPKIKRVICGLGVGTHFEKWGYDKNIIQENDWFSTIKLNDQQILHTLPARHFSGRGLIRNNTLWCSFLLQTQDLKIYIGGDSGYGKHFKQIGKQFGEIDLAILENGQYNKPWKYIHMFPEEVLKAANDLNARRLLPVHSAKFSLSQHAWDEPLKRITSLNKDLNLPLLTPIIGEIVELKNEKQTFNSWWEEIE